MCVSMNLFIKGDLVLCLFNTQHPFPVVSAPAQRDSSSCCFLAANQTHGEQANSWMLAADGTEPKRSRHSLALYSNKADFCI